MDVKLEDYGFIADTHSAGLVSRDGSIDWLCLPRFDSESCFAAILDSRNGGFWRIAPSDGGASTSRRYLPETMILETTFERPGGTVQLIDFLALEDLSHGKAPRAVQPNEIVVRLVRGVAGRVDMRMQFQPRFSYGDVAPWFRRVGTAIQAVGGPHALDLTSTVELEPGDSGVEASFTVGEGETECFLASYHLSHLDVPPASPREALGLLARTERFWHEWVAKCTYAGPRRAEVVRSLLSLKSLTFSPTGGVVAAPTTSLPEQLGGPRNWDYRFCWLRDATFTLDLFLEQGFVEEAREWRDWLSRAVRRPLA
jgi:GH15 family glucan-1,4-alpha-glucosidase